MAWRRQVQGPVVSLKPSYFGTCVLCLWDISISKAVVEWFDLNQTLPVHSRPETRSAAPFGHLAEPGCRHPLIKRDLRMAAARMNTAPLANHANLLAGIRLPGC